MSKKNQPAMVPVTIPVDNETLAKVEAEAKERGVTVEYVILEAIRDELGFDETGAVDILREGVE